MGRRILVVDDDERVLFVMDKILGRMSNGYEIVTAHNGREALDKAVDIPFDLVITDLRMSDVDGVELTKEIRALNPGVSVLWITAYGCHTVRDEAARLEVCRCLNKPLEMAEIRRVVLEVLENGGTELSVS